jgi:type I restriction enzyme S subunit
VKSVVNSSEPEIVPLSAKLPRGWTNVTIQDVCFLNPGLPVKLSSDADVSFVPMAAASEDGQITSRHVRKYREVAKGYTPFVNGDVLWAKITPCMENGKSAIASDLANGTGFGSTEFFVLRSNGSILPEFLHRFIRQERFRTAARKTMNSAVGQARVPKSFLLSSPIPLPPLAEQRRIVARLEALEARSRRARALLAEVPAQLAQARQSLLAAAFRGDLTAVWRRLHNSPDWQTKQIEDICIESFYGPRFSDNDYNPAGIPTIRTTDFTADGSIELLNTPRVMVPAERREKFLLRDGDLLVTRTGSIGKMAIFRGGYDALASAYLIRFRFNNQVTPDFVFNCLCSPKWQALMGLSTTAVTQPNINAEAIRRLPVPLPPLPEQHEIVRRLSAALARLDAAARAHAAAVAELDRLDQSLLARAFSGTLVPQNPDDEPAAELLARLSAKVHGR